MKLVYSANVTIAEYNSKIEIVHHMPNHNEHMLLVYIDGRLYGSHVTADWHIDHDVIRLAKNEHNRLLRDWHKVVTGDNDNACRAMLDGKPKPF